MRWIDYLPEIAKKEPEEQRTEIIWPTVHMGLTVDQFERVTGIERRRKENREFMESMFESLMNLYLQEIAPGIVNCKRRDV